MSKISLKHSGGNVVSLNSPTNAPSAADVAFKLPNADGTSGQVLKTDGSGNLSFGADTGGKILQVVQAVKTDVSSTSSESFSDIGSLSVNITPSSSSNKILVNWHGTYSSNSNRVGHIRLARDSSELIYVGDTGTSNQPRVTNSMAVTYTYFAESFAGTFLDSPNTTSQITYKLRFAAGDSGYTIYIGQMQDNNNEFSRSRQPASITVMEVAA